MVIKCGMINDNMQSALRDKVYVYLSSNPGFSGIRYYKLHAREQYVLSYFEQHHDTPNMSDLAKATGTPVKSLTRHVDNLAKLGYIERFTRPNNKLFIYIRCTETGAEVLKEVVDYSNSVLYELFEHYLDDMDLYELISCMNRITSVLSKIDSPELSEIRPVTTQTFDCN